MRAASMKTLWLQSWRFSLLTSAVATSLILMAATVSTAETYELPTPRQNQPTTQPCAAAVFQDLADGHLESVDLLTAAIVLGGTESTTEINRLRDVYARRSQAIRNEYHGDSVPVETLFRQMHSRFLTGGYDAACSQMAAMLNAGRYNCVTATILFQCLCRDFQIQATAIGVPGHVRSRVLAEPIRDVETTYPRWFDVAQDTHRLTSPAAPTRPLSDVQLLAKIYYNDGARLLQQGAHDAAITPLSRARELDPQDDAALQNVLAALINGALERAATGDYRGAAQRLRQANGVAPEFRPLRDNTLHIYQKWAAALCEQGHYANALQILESQYEQQPDQRLFREGRYVITRMWAMHHFLRGEIDAGLGIVTECRARFGDPPEFAAYEVAILREAIEALEANRNMPLARTLSQRASERHPDDQRLQVLHRRLAPLTATP